MKSFILYGTHTNIKGKKFEGIDMGHKYRLVDYAEEQGIKDDRNIIGLGHYCKCGHQLVINKQTGVVEHYSWDENHDGNGWGYLSIGTDIKCDCGCTKPEVPIEADRTFAKKKAIQQKKHNDYIKRYEEAKARPANQSRLILCDCGCGGRAEIKPKSKNFWKFW